jgi:predicted PurR-regulated permease PerM
MTQSQQLINSLTHQPALLYLAVAGGALIIALRSLKRALQPVGALVNAVAAAAVALLAICLALIMLAMAASASL